VGAVIGTLAGATLTDLLSKKRGLHWAALVPGIGLTISLPLQSAAFLVDSVLTMMTLVLLANCLSSAAVPSMFAALHLVCGSWRRATAVAVALFFANLFGLGLGPADHRRIKRYVCRGLWARRGTALRSAGHVHRSGTGGIFHVARSQAS
jgi:hypothetical protein